MVLARQLYSILLVLSLTFGIGQQKDSLINYTPRKIVFLAGTGGLTIGSLVWLNREWYDEYNTGHFRFFNDNDEWLQMDKIGHAWTNYQTSRILMQGFNWAGFSRNQKLIYGGGISFIYMTAIECLDGFSDGWGFSWGDEFANALGSGLAVSQEAFFKEQRIQLKLSYSESGLAQFNPKLLGDSPVSRVLKDYNGQTYWLSINPSSFIKKEPRTSSGKFLNILNVAIGYSAYGMTNARTNKEVTDKNGTVYFFNRERRFYLSLDVDLTRIKTKSKFLKSVFSVISIIKFPAPALQYSTKGFRFYPLYF